LIVVGSPAVGKTALIKVLCGDEFPANYQITTSPQLSFHRIPLKGSRKVEPFVFDLPSDVLFEHRWDRIESEADAHVYVFDVTRKETLDDVVNKWTAKLRDSHSDAPPIPGLLIGNKTDLSCRRAVSAAAAVAVAESLGLQFVETSAKDNRGFVHGQGRLEDGAGGGDDGAMFRDGDGEKTEGPITGAAGARGAAASIAFGGAFAETGEAETSFGGAEFKGAELKGGICDGS